MVGHTSRHKVSAYTVVGASFAPLLDGGISSPIGKQSAEEVEKEADAAEDAEEFEEAENHDRGIYKSVEFHTITQILDIEWFSPCAVERCAIHGA